MKDKLLIVSTLAFVAGSLAFACSSDDSGEGGGDGGSDAGGTSSGGSAGTDASAGTGGGSAGTGGGSAGTGGGSAGTGGGSTTDCDMMACEGVMAGGMELPTCCISATECGLSVGMMGGICVDRMTVENFLSDGGPFGAPEIIVEDPDCPDLTAMGFNLTGCCDASGVCGVSAMGFSQCITPADAAMFGFMGDAGAEVPCDYPADGGGGSTDAGGGGRGGGRDGG